MRGPGASVGVRWCEAAAARTGLSLLYSGKLTAVRGAARAPPESSLLLVRELAKSTGEQVLGRADRARW